jgi:perosamine synthetase
MRYPIYTPTIAPYTTSIHKAIADEWISSQGEFIEKSRQKCSELLNVPYVVMTNNGTSATHLLYASLRYKYPSLTRIYVPNYVFVAVWNCALYEYDSAIISVLRTDPCTLNMCVDEDYIQSLEINSAVVIVHNVGNVVNVPRLKRIRPDLIFVEDCCEAFLETYEGEPVGSAGLCGAISFFANKIITCGEGGIWFTHDKELYDFIYKTCHHGMTNERYVYDVLGYNYRMTNLQAALLYDQLCDIDRILDQKRRVYTRYCTLIKSTQFQVATTGLWMFLIRIPNGNYASVRNHMISHGIDTRPMFYEISEHSHLRMIRHEPQDIHHPEFVMLPSSPTLTTFDQCYIVNGLQTHISFTKATKQLLESFLETPMPSTFRYFNSRSVDHCLSTHTLTLLGMDGTTPICYGHIDDRWIGVCVLPSYQGKGIGRLLLQFLVNYATLEGIEQLRLTVDKDNVRALHLYRSYGFEIQETRPTLYLMVKDIIHLQ